jgi:hypothetical protein
MIPRRSGRWLTFVDASVNVGEQSVAQQNPSKCLSFALSAEGVGFEPTVDETAHNGFRARAGEAKSPV